MEDLIELVTEWEEVRRAKIANHLTVCQEIADTDSLVLENVLKRRAEEMLEDIENHRQKKKILKRHVWKRMAAVARERASNPAGRPK